MENISWKKVVQTDPLTCHFMARARFSLKDPILAVPSVGNDRHRTVTLATSHKANMHDFYKRQRPKADSSRQH